MRLQQIRTFRQELFGAVVALAVFALSPAPVSASEDVTPPLDVQVSLVTPARITLGEPILLRYKIANDVEQKVAAHLGVYGTDWYTITLRAANKTVMPSTQDPRPAQPSGAFSTQNGFLNRGGYSAGYIPVTKRMVIQHPGWYTLTLHVNIPYALGSDTAEGSPDAISQDMAFQILVTKADPVRLRATATTLQQAISKASVGSSTDVPLVRAELDALFSMPEAQAAESWKVLARQQNINTDWVASELADLRSVTGTDILAEMLHNPVITSTRVSTHLDELYNTGVPAVREHIKEIASRHGLNLPKHIGGPIIVD